MVTRASDHKMLLARRAAAEANYARTKKISDLTEVLRYSDDAQEKVTAAPERKGAPIGQRWE